MRFCSRYPAPWQLRSLCVGCARGHNAWARSMVASGRLWWSVWLVLATAGADGCSKRMLRKKGSHVRRRIIWLNAMRQLLTGKRGRVCQVRGRWPANHGHPIRSAAGVLGAFVALQGLGTGKAFPSPAGLSGKSSWCGFRLTTSHIVGALPCSSVLRAHGIS